MFTKIGPDRAHSDSGFTVTVTGPQEGPVLEYRESEKVLMGSLEPQWALWVSVNSKWEPPFESEPINAEKMKQIKANILEALDFLGYYYFHFS